MEEVFKIRNSIKILANVIKNLHNWLEMILLKQYMSSSHIYIPKLKPGLRHCQIH